MQSQPSWMILLVCSGCVHGSSARASNGAYKTKQDMIQHIPGLKGPPNSAVINYPLGAEGETFPFLVFQHGATAGLLTGSAYSKLLHVVASYGFIVVSPESCAIACAGADQDFMTTIDACRQDPSLHPALANATFDRVGVFGHSMGATSAAFLVSDQNNVNKYNIKAAASLDGGCFDMPGLPRMWHCFERKVPILYTTGSGLTNVGTRLPSQISYSKAGNVSKILWSILGGGHFEPVSSLGFKGREDVPVAQFLACHVKGEHCDSIYGPGGQAICKQAFALDACKVSGSAPNNAETVTLV